ncbi:hypothetical protein PSHT_12586 [Puccinia striiformis]|uniref:Uncharacterized protein n=1 Tax=Puccinia striiformis TaxID=27350 RepID=A0A2S4UVJ6_9BASI|nr:hypothetical protein PSHT_12586 [Puccinia striiformis]
MKISEPLAPSHHCLHSETSSEKLHRGGWDEIFGKLSHRWLRAKVRGENPPKDTLKDLSPEQIRSRQDHIKRLN